MSSRGWVVKLRFGRSFQHAHAGPRRLFPRTQPKRSECSSRIQSFTGSFHFCLGSGLDRIKLVLTDLITEIPADRGLVEAGYATFAEWRQLTSRHASFFNYDPERRAYCMITVPAPWRDTPGPTWQLVAAMLRNQQRQFSDEPARLIQQRLELV
jgi:hypothetical protein